MIHILMFLPLTLALAVPQDYQYAIPAMSGDAEAYLEYLPQISGGLNARKVRKTINYLKKFVHLLLLRMKMQSKWMEAFATRISVAISSMA